MPVLGQNNPPAPPASDTTNPMGAGSTAGVVLGKDTGGGGGNNGGGTGPGTGPGTSPAGVMGLLGGQVREVKKRIASLLGDPDRDWLTDAYLMPLLNQVYEQQIQYLAGTCNPFLIRMVGLFNLPSGATDLTRYQTDGTAPLARMQNPLALWWKQAGVPENRYAPMMMYDTLPDMAPQSSGVSSVAMYGRKLGYEWRGNRLYITPVPFPIDVRVRGEFLPPYLTQDDQYVEIHPSLPHALAYGVAALVAIERGNPEWVQSYGQLALSSLDEIGAAMIRQQQKVTYRLGRANGRRRF